MDALLNGHAVTFLVAAALIAAPEVPEAGPISNDLRERFELDPFYHHAAMARAVPVVGSERTSAAALTEAAWVLERMTAGRPELMTALAKARGRVCVIAAVEMAPDIPEFADMRPARAFYDARGRGYGNRRACSIGEENVLNLPGDPFSTECILIHEFAHLLDAAALETVVPDFKAKRLAAYRAATEAGLWKGTYAGTNPAEYWAEITQSWFDTNRENDRDHNDVDTREELREYDPRAAALLIEAYGDGPWRYTRAAERREMLHLANYEPAGADRFEWPAEVRERYDALTSGTPESARVLQQAGVETWSLLTEPIVSKRSREPSTMIVANKTGSAVSIIWITPEGNAQQYGTVRPGFVVTRPTYSEHAWEFRDPDGRSLGRVRSDGVGRVLLQRQADVAPVKRSRGRE